MTLGSGPIRSAPEIADLHIDVGDPAALPPDMLEDLNRQRAIMFDVLGVDHEGLPGTAESGYA
jgi:hypothetical protein